MILITDVDDRCSLVATSSHLIVPLSVFAPIFMEISADAPLA